ncbi:condensation domain-containing protein, partial [Burkholderia sp. SIMBA_052]|uniref:condensation domain-containing protein n=1 Tax=Burkholderia sp. SIMBA_052 TaxID=3085793 RepID=UPI00397CF45A
TNHHILMDGWSNSQLLGEVLQRYAGQLPQHLTGRYRDYIAWLQRQDATLSEHFWKQQLQGLDEPTRLAQAIAAGARAPLEEGHGSHGCTLDEAQTRSLGEFARQHADHHRALRVGIEHVSFARAAARFAHQRSDAGQ